MEQEEEEMAKVRPEIQRSIVPGTTKRVSRRKDKSMGSNFAERIRKLRTKKIWLNSTKKEEVLHSFKKTLWRWKPDCMK